MMQNTLRLILANDNEVAPKPKVEIVPTTSAHIRELSRNLREKDRKEIENYGFSANKGLWYGFRRGLNNKTAFVDGELAACWGCAGEYLGEIGQPWLLTTNAVYKISPLRFARIYQLEVKEMLGLFPNLVNYVLNSYDEAIRLLQIVGFTVGEPETIGHGMYRKFSIGVG